MYTPTRLGLQQFGLGMTGNAGALALDAQYALDPLLIKTTRTSSDVVTQADGSLAQIAINEPAIDGMTYSGGTYSDAGLTQTSTLRTRYGSVSTYDEAPALHVQGSAVNLLTYSEQFDNAAWSKSLATVTANTTAAPDGATTADTLSDDSSGGTGQPQILMVPTVSAGYSTASIYAKKNGADYLSIRAEGFDALQTAWFNLASGSVGTVSGTGALASIEDAGNGFYRCSLHFTTTTDLSGVLRIYPCESDGSVNSNLDGTTSIFIWGAQLETGSYASSYIPTTTATDSRAAATNVLADADGNVLTPADVGWTADSIYGELTVTPDVGGQSAVYTLSSYLDTSNELLIVSIPSITVIRKRCSGTNYEANFSYTHLKDTEMAIRFYSDTTNGLGISINGGAWSTNPDTTANCLGSTVQVGSRNGAGHFVGLYEIGKLKTYKSRAEAISKGGWSDLP